MALTFKRDNKAKYLILVLHVRENRLRQKKREEKRREKKKRREEKKRREKKNKKKKKKKKKRREEEEIKVWNLLGTFVWILYGFWYEFLYGYLFGGLEYLFLCIILVWNGCLVWLWSSMEENFV